MRNNWTVTATAEELYYIDVYRGASIMLFVKAFTRSGAKRKALRKLRHRYINIKINSIEQGE